MVTNENEPPPGPRTPRTVTVLAMLAATSLIFSYLAAYALTNALIAGGAAAPWPPDHDPRPHRMLVCFVVLMCVFAAVGGAFRWVSQRQLRSIDDMGED